MKSTTVNGIRFENIEKTYVRNDGYGRSSLSVRADVGGDRIEMTSFNGGPIEMYRLGDNGIFAFVGYLPYLESTTNVWGHGFPSIYRQFWAKIHQSKLGRAALAHTEVVR